MSTFRIVAQAVALNTMLAGVGAAASAPERIFGAYSLICPAGGVPCEPAPEAMKLTRKRGGKVGVKIKLVYTAGHTCRLEGDGRWKEDRIVLEAEGLEAGKACRIEISFQDAQASLNDVGERCAPVYCGTRGTFQGAAFSKAVP